MEDVRAGLQVRAIRLKRGLRQVDLAGRLGVSRETISRVEAGGIDAMDIGLLRRVSQALAMPPIVSVGWRGADVAQLLDAGHAALVDHAVTVLRGLHWEVVVEYSFAHFGERGSVDILSWHAATSTLLIIEVKTRIVDLQDLLGTLDRKKRLVPKLVADDHDWRAMHVGVVLVAPSTTAIRSAIDRHAATFEAALPARTVVVRRWMKAPAGDVRGIWFVRDSHAV